MALPGLVVVRYNNYLGTFQSRAVRRTPFAGPHGIGCGREVPFFQRVNIFLALNDEYILLLFYCPHYEGQSIEDGAFLG